MRERARGIGVCRIGEWRGVRMATHATELFASAEQAKGYQRGSNDGWEVNPKTPSNSEFKVL